MTSTYLHESTSSEVSDEVSRSSYFFAFEIFTVSANHANYNYHIWKIDTNLIKQTGRTACQFLLI